MTIEIDADDMNALRSRLGDASAGARRAVPPMPGGAAFGSPLLAAAVASFETAVRRDAQDLQDRWAALDAGVREMFEDMNELEAGVAADLKRIHEELA